MTISTTKCKALTAFSVFVPDYGIVHGDPDSSLPEAKEPLVPDTIKQALADEKKIEIPGTKTP